MVIASCKWFIGFFLPVLLMPAPPSTDVRPHPFHVSVTEINHNAVEKTLEVSCKIFTDDFEEALTKRFKSKVDLVHPKDKAAMDHLLTGYIHEHLQLKADDKSLVLNYIGFEVENEAVFIYLQATGISTVKKLDANDSILYDMFNDQTEIIHASAGGTRKSLKIDFPVREASFQF